MPEPRQRKPILLFAARVLGWLVPCFLAWYWLAPWLDRPAAWLAQGWLALFDDAILDSVEFEGRLLELVTNIGVQASAGRGVFVVEVNPLLSTYGAPLFAALVLASRGGLARLVLGLAALLPFQGWSVAFDFLAQIVRAGPEMGAASHFAGWRIELIAFAYQLGSLIFPTLAPVALWVALQRRYVGELAGAAPFRAAPATPGTIEVGGPDGAR